MTWPRCTDWQVTGCGRPSDTSQGPGPARTTPTTTITTPASEGASRSNAVSRSGRPASRGGERRGPQEHEAGPGRRESHARSVGEDGHHAEPGPMQGDGAQDHHHSRRAGQEAAHDSRWSACRPTSCPARRPPRHGNVVGDRMPGAEPGTPRPRGLNEVGERLERSSPRLPARPRPPRWSRPVCPGPAWERAVRRHSRPPPTRRLGAGRTRGAPNATPTCTVDARSRSVPTSGQVTGITSEGLGSPQGRRHPPHGGSTAIRFPPEGGTHRRRPATTPGRDHPGRASGSPSPSSWLGHRSAWSPPFTLLTTHTAWMWDERSTGTRFRETVRPIASTRACSGKRWRLGQLT